MRRMQYGRLRLWVLVVQAWFAANNSKSSGAAPFSR
jgi:hypothetical protein